MTTVTTTLVSGQNAYVGAISSRGEYSVSVNSGVQGPTGANGVSITAANVVSGNLVLTLSNTATIDAGSVIGANGANGAAANTGNVTFSNTTISTSTVNTNLVIQTRNVDPSSSPAINSTSSWTFGYDSSLTFPDATIQYTAYTGTANNSLYLGGIAANQYAYANQVSTNAAAQYAWTNTHSFSNSVTFSGSAVVPSSNTLGTALGSATQRWVLIANTGTFSGAVSGITTLATGNTTITGFANVTSTIQGGSSLIIAGAASGITTLAAGNTTITGFANVTSTIQGGSTLIIAGAASGITTLAAGNTTITGFANVSTTLQVTGAATLSANLTVSGNIAGNTAGFAIGYRDVPQNFTNTSMTLALTDAGKHILTQNSGSSTQTITIPPNGTIAFQTGTTITIVVQSTGTVAVANGAGVTMYLTGNSTAKSTVTLNSYSMATLLKIGTNSWIVSGTGAT